MTKKEKERREEMRIGMKWHDEDEIKKKSSVRKLQKDRKRHK